MIKINYNGRDIYKPGYCGHAWWNHIWKLLKKDHRYTEQQITAFLKITDTLIRLDLHGEQLWREDGR